MRLRVAILIGFVLGHSIGLLGLPAVALAGSTSQLVISELEPGSSGHSGDEFVELYNPTASDISISNWALQYKSPAGTSWTSKVSSLTGSVKAHGFYLIGAGAYAGTADYKLTGSLSFGDSAGVVRLMDPSQIPVDTVAWGSTAVGGEGTPATAPSGGMSLERLAGPYAADGGNGIDTNDNAADFVLRPTPEPQSSAAPVEAPVDVDFDYPALELTEVAPATGSGSDSFVELHNPTTSPVYLGGYELSVGDNTYTLTPAMLGADSYLVVTSAVSKLPLSISNGAVKLLNPAGDEADEAAAWDETLPNAAWGLFADGWQWTGQATPGAANILTDVSSTSTVTDPESGQTMYPALALSEFLPDPAAPGTDAADEFIELYNPTDNPVDLAGYKLESGSSLGNNVILGDRVIAPQSWLALTSAETHLPLANGGGEVALFDPAGVQLGLITYGAAKTGQAYADIDGNWAWTTTPTPGAANILTAPAVLSAAAKTTKAKAAAKPKAAKAVKAKTTKAKTTKAKKTSAAKTVLASVTSPGGHWLLFALVGLTIGYVIYEFRYDLRNYYYRLRGHASPRSTSSSLIARWRRYRAGE